MQNKYSHIADMENIMVRQENLNHKLETVLKEMDIQGANYKKLLEYYYSEQRMKDLEDEEKHLIPEDLKRGVLSEDEVYNLFQDTHDAALHMIETALKILKTDDK